MERNPYSIASRSISGGLIRLQAHLTNWGAWMGPTWAVVCGVVASDGFGWRGEDWIRLALLVLLVDGGWGTLWSSLGGVNWAKPLRRWRHWRFGAPFATPPYTLPNSPGDRISRWLGQLGAWWRDVFWPACGPAFSAIVIAFAVTVVLAVLLGTELLLLSAATLAVMQLGLAWEGGRGTVAPHWDALVAVMMPWLAGHVAFGALGLRSLGLALAYAISWGAAWRVDSPWERALGIGSQFLAAALFVVLRSPLAAGGLLLLLVPQVALFPWLRRGQSAAWYARHARPWLMAAMLIAAWAARSL